MNTNSNIYLVTGAAGFIGSHITERLLDKGFHVRGIDNFSTGKRQNIEKFRTNDNFEFIEGDICEPQICDEVCKNVSYILHQAALGSVPKSISFPTLYIQNNIVGFHNIIEASSKQKVKRVVFASSSSIYGDNKDGIKTEENTGSVLSPYAITKKFDEEYANLFYRLYGVETIALRYFNVFGERQDPNSNYAAVIPCFVKALHENKAPIIYGDGEQRRDFTYVENVVTANLLACKAPSDACGQAYNIACGKQTSINQLYKYILNIYNKDETPHPIYMPERNGDIKNSLANIQKSQQKLNYKPIIDIEKGLVNTVNWYIEYLNSNKIKK